MKYIKRTNNNSMFFKNPIFTSPSSIIYIMLKKIILPVVILIFTQQNFYGTEGVNPKQKDPTEIWKTINNWINRDYSPDNNKNYPKLWWLWAFLDNVPFQYGGSKIWKHGEAYYGLSNGIGFFPSFLNFGWLKIGIVDAHINVINLILDYFKSFIQFETEKAPDIDSFLFGPIGVNLYFNIHIISFKILNYIKIKLIAPLTLLLVGYKDGTAWYITYNKDDQISRWYALLSPRIEINIPGIINYLSGSNK